MQLDPSITRVKSLCDHCGNITFKHLIVQDGPPKPEGQTPKSLQEQIQQSLKNRAAHRLYKCEICQNVILQSLTAQVISVQPLKFKERIEQLWPPALSLPPEVPDRIRQIYEEARAVRKSPTSFVVQIGRALEAMTRNQGAEGKTLNDKLNWLVNKNRLPKVLGEMGHLTRIFRNWGAHDTEIDVEPQDVQTVDDFFKAVIEYIYVAPTKVAIMKNRVQTQQHKKTVSKKSTSKTSPR